MERAAQKGRNTRRWSETMRRRFLDHLAATCNVRESAEAAGVEASSVYYLRRRYPEFAAAWGEALKLGYEMLETRLVGHALAGRGMCDAMDRDGLGTIDTHLALTMLTAHRNAMAGTAHKGGPKLKRATEEETNAALMKKLDAIERRQREAQE